MKKESEDERLLGITLDRTTNFLPAEKLSELVKNIEKLGFESVWLLDAFGREPFIAASFILSHTSTLKVGTGVATVYGRDPTGAVQALETLSEMYPGRFYMGLGASNPIVVEKRKGAWVPPLPKMKQYLQEMSDVTLAFLKHDTKAPLIIAAHAPGLQSLAVDNAQGIMTWMMPAKIVAEAREHVGSELEITSQILCVMNTDPHESRSIARAYLAMYLALPYYQKAFVKAGFDLDECTEQGGSDRLIDSVVAWGTPAQILERVKEFRQAGATRVVLNPLRADPSKQGPDGGQVVTGDWEGLEKLAKAIDSERREK